MLDWSAFSSIFVLSFGICAFLVATRRFHMELTRRDDDMVAAQALHDVPTPRIGGLAITAGIVLGFFMVPSAHHDMFALFALTIIPVFLSGLAEDIGFRVTPLGRLLAAAVSAGVAVGLLGIWVPPFQIEMLDAVFGLAPVAIVITVVWSSGVCHGFNLIDGVNGLAAGVGIVIAVGLWALAERAGQPEIAAVCLVLVPALMGFLAFNWPMGRIFLGDAGAYCVGHVLVWLAIVVAWHAPAVAPTAIALMFFWPVADMLLAIWRRRKHGRPFDAPDRLHFHQLVYRTLTIVLGDRVPRVWINSLTGVAIVPFAGLPVIAGYMLWNNPVLSLLAWVVFGALFVATYVYGTRLVRRRSFRRSRRRPALA